MRIVKVMMLVVAIALVPLSIGLVMLKQQQNAQDALNRALTSQASEQRYLYEGVREQASSTLLMLSQNPVLNSIFTDPSHAGEIRKKIDGTLLYLGREIYPQLMSSAGVFDNFGKCPNNNCRYEVARVGFNYGYSEQSLVQLRYLLQSGQNWQKLARRLHQGEVYTSGISRSTDSLRYVVTFATLLPPINGKNRGTLYFELDIENFRQAAAEAVTRERVKGLDFVIINRRGRVLMNSAIKQGTGELVGANDKRFVAIAKLSAAQKASSGLTTIATKQGKLRVAWQRLPVSKLNANHWTVVVAAPALSGNVISKNPIPVGLMAAALLVIAFIMGRRWVRTSTQALTDPLTGLGNRRKLVADLQKALPDAGEAAPLLLALFDLDGFKNYNDSFGHPAGDALLARLGRNVQVSMREHGGEAYRMGGDEFCIIVSIGADGQGPIVADATAALSERGEGFAIGSSYGCVLLPQEANDVAISLRLADQRLYANKNSGRRSAGRQSADVLLQALHERSPELGDHLVDVARLAAEVGRRLGMSGEELDQLAQAAQLHDVGKMAIPDAILKKPGPLDREEWEFIRGHTVVGERIISAAPSLSQVSRIVRSSHERYNGSGYPDGLRGEEIPLPSRIIAVCDAYDAMIGPRPYRLGMNRDNAASELRRCAGAQFDPVVIEFFLSVVDELVREAEQVPVNPS
jgi:diguanylate cyclase (GGDEF)-like protein